MKSLFKILPLALLLTACTSSPAAIVNTVADVQGGNITYLPFGKQRAFYVRGKVSHNAYVFGRGLLTLTDEAAPQTQISVTVSSPYAVGSIATLKVTKQAVFTLDDNGLTVYCETE
jgi:hypothetical protein